VYSDGTYPAAYPAHPNPPAQVPLATNNGRQFPLRPNQLAQVNADITLRNRQKSPIQINMRDIANEIRAIRWGLLLQCRVMRTMLLGASDGFWIIQFYQQWAGFVAKDWTSTLSMISRYDLCEQVTLQSAAIQNVTLARQAQCVRNDRKLSDKEVQSLEDIFSKMEKYQI
jgi:hypothetical protein